MESKTEVDEVSFMFSQDIKQVRIKLTKFNKEIPLIYEFLIN